MLNGLFPHTGRLNLRGYGLLAVLALLVFLPGFFTIPPTDRDESRFTQASKQMIRSGDLVDIRFQEEARHKKPVAIYWMQAASVKALEAVSGHYLEDSIWAYRVPSLLGAVLAVLFTAAIGTRLFDARTGFAAGLFMAACLMLNIEARMGKTDAVLLATILAAQMVLAKAYVRAGFAHALKIKDALIFWLAMGIGFLVKGPIILLAVGGTVLALAIMKEPMRWLKTLRPISGFVLMLLVVLPWFYMITERTHGEFYNESAGRDLLAKIWEGQNWGGAPPGFYLVTLWAIFWPVSLPLILALPSVWKQRRLPNIRFLIAWIIPTWITFELIMTKLVHYVLPTYPALAILAAAWLMDNNRQAPKLWVWGVSIIWGLVSIGLCLAPIALPVVVEGMPDLGQMFFASLGLALAFAALHIINNALNKASNDSAQLAIPVLALAGVLTVTALLGFMLPGLKSVFVSARIAENLPAAESSCKQITVFTAGYNEPSLVFLAGTQTRFAEAGEAVADAIKKDRCNVGLVDSQQLEPFRNAAKKEKIKYQTLAEIKGFNYGRGKAVTLELVRRQ